MQHKNTAMIFSSDGEEESGQNQTQPGDSTASLIIKITNQKTTRQGPIYEVINFLSW